MTAEQLAALPEDGKRYELVDGVLRVMSPAGGRHGRVAGEVFLQIAQHAKRHRLGQAYAAETGFLLRRDPDTVRAPDVAFVSHGRLGPYADHPGYLPLAPDLVAEVISPGDNLSEAGAKASSWIEAGVLVVLLVDPQRGTVRTCRPGRESLVRADGVVDLDDVLPGLRLDVSELFH
jgi:Uma2 family endonuclease